jgi:glutathione S-transferase
MVGLQKSGESAVTEFLRQRVRTAFGIVESHLAGRAFVLGERPTIADISMVGYLYYPEETGLDRSATPNMEAWTQRVAALPGWKHPYDLMPRALRQ